MLRFIFPMLLMFLLSAPIQAQTLGPTLPLEAQKDDVQTLVERGLEAARQEAWTLALRYFNEAHKAEPLSPPVLFNLGLAHAKAGHELVAIAWLKAYLAADPKAQNVEAVQKEITRLEIATEAKIQKIFQEAVAAATELPEAVDRQRVLQDIAWKQASAGDIEGALKTSKLAGESDASLLWQYYGQALVWAGDLKGAQDALSHITNASDKDPLLATIAESLAGQGDIVGAYKWANQIQEQVYARTSAFRVIVERCIVEGDFAGAREAANHISDDAGKMDSLGGIAQALLRRGDVAGAKAIAMDIPAHIVAGAKYASTGSVVARTLRGDHEGARALASGGLRLNEQWGPGEVALALHGTDSRFGVIAEVQLRLGNMQEARKTAKAAADTAAREQLDVFRPGNPEGAIAEVQLEKGEIAQALETAQKTRFYVKRWLLYQIVLAQIKAGDLAGAERTIDLIHAGREGVYDAYERKDLDTASRAKVESLLALADADSKKGAVSEAVRLLGAASQVATDVTSGSDINKEDVASLLERIAEAQEKAGDTAGAAVARRHSSALNPTAKAPIQLARWIRLAQRLANYKEVVNLGDMLKEAGTRDWEGKPVSIQNIPGQIAGVASSLSRIWNEIRSLERELSKVQATPQK